MQLSKFQCKTLELRLAQGYNTPRLRFTPCYILSLHKALLLNMLEKSRAMKFHGGKKLRRFAIAIVLLVLLTANVVLAQGQPEIFIPKLRHDFGQVFEMEKYEYVFTVRNKGNADLIIKDVKPG